MPPRSARFRRLRLVMEGGGRPARLAYRLGLQGPVTVETHDIPIAAWPSGTPPVRIVYASDFHAGGTTDPLLLRDALLALVAAGPDLLLFGGDFVNLQARFIDELAPRLAEVPAPLGRFAVLGNHDYDTDAGRVVRRLEAAGIVMLTNRSVEVGTPEAPLSVCGLDDDLFGRPDPAVAFADAGPVRVVLMHAPSSLLEADVHPFRLALCGHVHGGQIALPGGIPLVVPEGRLSRRYARGRYELGPERTLIVSRGIGCTGLPVRLFSLPEVTVCELHGPAPQGRGLPRPD